MNFVFNLCFIDRNSQKLYIYFLQICFLPPTCSSQRSLPKVSVLPGPLPLLLFCLTCCVSARLKMSLETTFPWLCLVTPPHQFFPTCIPSPPMKSTSFLSMTKETVSLWPVKRPHLKVRVLIWLDVKTVKWGNNLTFILYFCFRARHGTKSTGHRGNDKQFQGVMAGSSRFGDQIPPVLCPTQRYRRNIGGSNSWTGNYHSSPGVVPNHHLPCVCVCWILNWHWRWDAGGWYHQGRWVCRLLFKEKCDGYIC